MEEQNCILRCGYWLLYVEFCSVLSNVVNIHYNQACLESLILNILISRRHMALLVCLQKVLFRSIQSDQAKSYVVKMVSKLIHNLWA